MEIVLASASPRRKELLGLIADRFTVRVSDAEEILPEGIDPFSAPEFLAEIKAAAVREKCPNDLVIGADTAVFYGERMLGKPRDEKEAREMLTVLSGKTHRVITGCALFYKDRKKTFSVSTEVEFYPLSEKDIEWYIATNEWADKAGAYGIQGKGSALVKGIKGDYFSVVGLPVAELKRKIEEIIE